MMQYLMALCLVLFATPAHAEIYAALDEHGRLEVSGQRKSQRFVRFVPGQAEPRAIKVSGKVRVPGRGLSRLIAMVAREHHVDARLMHAIIHVESAYNARAVSAKGALGLMQILPSTGSRLGATNLLEPAQNLRAGAVHLRGLINRFHGDVVLALAAYNAGEVAVRKYGNRVPPYRETQHYVDRVLARYRDTPALDSYL
jgi:soluble lytic murein transglycosylase-like protein